MKNFPTSHIVVLIAGFAGFFAIVAVSPLLSESSQSVAVSDPVVQEVAKLSERLIRDEKLNKQGVVTYTFYADPVPEQIVPDEVPEMRTASSYTRLLGVEGEGASETYSMNLISFPQETFAQAPDGTWRYIETATTTKEAWDRRPQRFAISWGTYFASIAEAAGAPSYAAAGDGQVTGISVGSGAGCSTVWATAHNATTGSADYTATTFAAWSDSYQEGMPLECEINIYRAFIPFDTSAIRYTSTITAASLIVYVTSKFEGFDDAYDFVTVVRGSQASHNSLVGTDYNDLGTTEGIDAGQRKDIVSISTGATLTFTLNATGRGWIAKRGESSNCSLAEGISCFGVREGHDFSDVRPSGFDPTTYAQVTMSASETVGISQDPTLSVTYNVAGPEIKGAIRSSIMKIQSGAVRLRSY